MRSNVIKFDKLDLTNGIESDSINLSQKKSLNKMILDELSVILGQDINKGLKMIEQFISNEEMVAFKSKLENQISTKQEVSYEAISNKRHLNNLKSCFEGISSDSIL
ncbi:hypothetical protein [Ancylomarina sp. 16SWW S1-10-2]|uniref:hypothetical protein n=1 Tax=Ancylomarina sp. 16SWW S1-10-2 TaxID=2499681 RepID=UPI0012AD75EC|nr:hypothetical protein [Ancylomarina sp. 16SWW S1-10-2]MRT94173.1 hypothetical protein [Ancylomarina sp. 16SWW S1-10-2]